MKKMDGHNFYMDSNKRMKRIVVILSSVIVILMLFILFFFVARPQFIKYVQEKQIEAINSYVYGEIIGQVKGQGYYMIPLGEKEAPLVLVPYNPPAEQNVNNAQ